MTRKQFALLAFLVIIAGFFGGMLSERIFPARTISAETEQAGSPGIVTASGLHLMDASGNRRGACFFYLRTGV